MADDSEFRQSLVEIKTLVELDGSLVPGEVLPLEVLHMEHATRPVQGICPSLPFQGFDEKMTPILEGAAGLRNVICAP